MKITSIWHHISGVHAKIKNKTLGETENTLEI